MVEKSRYFELELPIINEKVELLASSEDKLAGRSIKIDLTRKLRGKSLEITFKIIKHEKIEIIPHRIHLLGYFIRRMIRSSISYAEDSFSASSKNALLRIKPFLITRKKVSRSIRKALRDKAREEIINEIKEKNYEDIFSEIVAGRFQKNLSLKLKKIYPLALCEIRDIFVEKHKESQEEKV